MRELLLAREKELKEKYSQMKQNRLNLLEAADKFFNEMLKLEGAFTEIEKLLKETKPNANKS